MASILAPIALLAPAPAQLVTLDAARWDRRLLVLFAPRRDDPALVRQRRLLNGRAMATRDLHVVEVIGESVSGLREYAGRLRQRYGVDGRAFRVVLVGKDGGVKLRRREPLTMETLSATIDAMPMRRAEMRR